MLDLIYPRKLSCILCEGEYGFCECESEIERPEGNLCKCCGRGLGTPMSAYYHMPRGKTISRGKTVRMHICYRCYHKPPWLNAHRSYAMYKGQVRQSVLRLKYVDRIQNAKYWAGKLSHLYTEICESEENAPSEPFYEGSGYPVVRDLPGPFTSPDLVTFVPISWQRMVKRGYNQGAEIAKHFCKMNGLEYASILRRSRNTRKFSRLGRIERSLEISSALKIKKCFRERIGGKKIIVIDDIYTTGATLNTVAKILKQNGAASVVALTAAMD